MKSILASLLLLFTVVANAQPACRVTDTTLISRNIAGGSGADGSAVQSMSDSGRFVAFNSYTPDILPTPVNMPGGRNIYVWDRLNNTYRAVDSAPPGQGLNNSFQEFAISGNGRFVGFTTQANNVAGPDGNAQLDVYVKDLALNSYDRASKPDPSVGNISESKHSSASIALSNDGNLVAFVSSGLVFTTYYFNPSDPAVYNFHMYVRNRAAGTTQIVTRGRDANNNPQPLFGTLGRPALTADGLTIAFSSDATNLENFRRTDTKRDVFIAVWTGQWNVIERIPTEAQGIEYIHRDLVDISPDGRYVGYVADHGNATYELYVYDRINHSTFRPRPGGTRPAFSGVTEFQLGSDVVVWRDGLDLTNEGQAGGYWFRFPSPSWPDGIFQRVGREESGNPACCGSNGYDGLPGGIVVSADGAWTAFSSASPRIDTPDGNGRLDVFVQKMGASADFSFACTGLNCQFDASPTASACLVNSWSWSFGDSTSGSGSAPLHGYLAAGSYDVTLSVTDVNGVQSSVTKKVTVTSNLPSAAMRYVTVTPCRLWDTRDAVSYPGAHKLNSNESLVLNTSATSTCGSYPNARAVSLNLTAVQPTAAGHVLGYATGAPSSSSVLNYAAATSPRANNSIIPVAADATFTLKPVVAAAGSVHLIADINGYFTDAPAAGSLGFQPLTPCRLHDSRFDPAPDGQIRPLNPNEQRPIVAQSSPKNCGIVSGAAAASLNVAIVTPSALGHFILFPNGTPVPLVSNVNFNAGTTIANGARVSLASTTPDLGTSIVIPGGTAHLVVDTNGYFKSDAPLQFHPITPCRALDTRFSPQGPAIENGERRGVPIRGNCGIPADAQAAMINITVVGPTTVGHITAYPSGITTPSASTINFSAGEPALANGSIVPLSPVLANDLTLNAVLPGFGTTHVVIDVFGYFK